MELKRLHYMVDQIARNFVALGYENAVAATADHIAKFWDPRMKAAIFTAPQDGLSPVAAAAVAQLARGDTPASQSRATEFNGTGQLGHSDAG